MVQPRHCIMTRAYESICMDGKNNVSERHKELSEHKRSSSFPNLECEKNISIKITTNIYIRGGEIFYDLQ